MLAFIIWLLMWLLRIKRCLDTAEEARRAAAEAKERAGDAREEKEEEIDPKVAPAERARAMLEDKADKARAAENAASPPPKGGESEVAQKAEKAADALHRQADHPGNARAATKARAVSAQASRLAGELNMAAREVEGKAQSAEQAAANCKGPAAEKAKQAAQEARAAANDLRQLAGELNAAAQAGQNLDSEVANGRAQARSTWNAGQAAGAGIGRPAKPIPRHWRGE
jgi:hypothetical protein